MKQQHVKVGFPWCVLSFSFFFFQIFCEERYMLYSTLEVQETENSSLALFDLQGVSLIHCGSRCLAEHCCKEFIYHKGSLRCFGIQLEDFERTAKNNLITMGNEGMSTYRKGTLLYIIISFPLVFMSPLHNMWFCYSLSLSLSINYCND